jgi:peptide/nickel transport system permease protein
VVWVFAYLLGDWTGLPVTGSLYTIDEFEGPQLILRNMILPVFTLGVRPLAILMQLTRNSMLDVLSHDYVRTATAKGLPQSTVIWKHTLKNALNPVITAASGWFASLLAGAVFVEIVFGWQGLGLVILNALNTYDIPVVMGAVMLVSGVFVIISLAVDLLYGIFDPRVRIQ